MRQVTVTLVSIQHMFQTPTSESSERGRGPVPARRPAPQRAVGAKPVVTDWPRLQSETIRVAAFPSHLQLHKASKLKWGGFPGVWLNRGFFASWQSTIVDAEKQM